MLDEKVSSGMQNIQAQITLHTNLSEFEMDFYSPVNIV